jgi:hypothetical protein
MLFPQEENTFKVMEIQMKKKCNFICTYLKKKSDFIILDFQTYFFRGPGTVKPIAPGPDKNFPRAAWFSGLL